jgi:hypothetical protein
MESQIQLAGSHNACPLSPTAFTTPSTAGWRMLQSKLKLNHRITPDISEKIS